MKGAKGNGWRTALSVVAGLGILAGVIYFVGWREMLAEMRALGPWGMLSVILNVMLAMATWVLCWMIILRAYGIRIPILRIVGARLSGYAISYLTPTMYFGGEPFRAMLVSDVTSAPATRVFATIIVERFLGGLSMIVFILAGGIAAVFSPAVSAEGKRLLIAGTAFIAVWILVGLVNFAGNFQWISRLVRLLGRIIPRWERGLARAAGKVSETEDEVHYAFTQHRRATFLAFLVQTAATFFVFMRPAVFFVFSSGVQFSFPQLSLLFSFNTLLSTFLWVTPGGLGTGEAGMIGVYKLVAPNITSQGVVAYSLVYKFAEALLVAGGLYFLFRRGVSYVRRRAAKGGNPTETSQES